MTNMHLNGIITRGVGGFYTVHSSDGENYTCKARGLFRKNHLTPIVGDHVLFETDGGGRGYLLNIEPRKNVLLRPAVANIDKLFVVISAGKPVPDLLLVDKLLIYCEELDIVPILVINKCDAAQEKDIAELISQYISSGYRICCVSALTGLGIAELRQEISSGISCFAGQSAVGKSSLLNALIPGIYLQTGEMSEKTERGRHTTRHVELILVPNGGAVFDTPGFSFLEGLQIEPEMLGSHYPELREAEGSCRFTGCLHASEPGCHVKENMLNTSISIQRYERYLKLLNEANEVRRHKYD